MKLINDFKQFTLRGNLIDMAIGFTVGAAFTTVAKSLVNDIIMPPIGWLIGRQDFTDMFWMIPGTAKEGMPLDTLAEAKAAGAVTINYGIFLNNALALTLVALSMFIAIRLYNKIEDELEERFAEPPPPPGEPSEKKCPDCLAVIPIKAKRCKYCTSWLDGRTGT
ncbi:MAG: large conductance mechanosensitive channel protein MscL [Coraliomargarita sp.]|nr:large conductance mechanosensitive channel protein MscL [Coraliomargarita sp.]